MPLGYHYFRLVLSRWKLVVSLVVGCTLAALALSVFVLAQRPTFDSAARLNIVPTSEELGYASRFVRGSTFDGGSVLLQTYAEFAHTRPIVAPIVDRYIAEQARAVGQPVDEWIAENSVPSPFSPGRIISLLNYGEAPPVPLRDDLIDNVTKNTLIESVEGTYLVRITVSWDDPQSAAWFANALADAIVERAERTSRSSGAQIADALVLRLNEKRAQLANVLRQSRELKSRAGVVDIDRQKQSLLEAQVAEQSRLTSDRAQLQASESQVAGLKRQTEGKLSSSQQLVEQTLAIEGPKVAGLRRGVSIRQDRVGQIDSQIAALGQHEDQIKALDYAAAALQTEVNALTERASFSQTENIANAPRIQLIERAKPPLTRSSPKTLFNTILGFIAGCALAGCALLLLGEARPAESDAEAEADALEPEFTPAPPPPAPAPRAAPVATPAVPPPLSPLRPRTDTPPSPFRHVRANTVTTAVHGGATMGSLALADPVEELQLADPIIEPAAEPVLRVVAPEAATSDVTSSLCPLLLPPPAHGIGYRGNESLREREAFLRWFAVPLAASDKPLLVVGPVGDTAVKQVFRLIHEAFAATGQRTRTIDATRRRLPAEWPADHRKPLIYAGGLRESGRAAVLDEIGADADVLVVIVAASLEIAQAQAAKVAPLAGKQLHVVAIAG